MVSPRRPRIGVDFHTFDGIFQGSRSHLLGLYQVAIAMAPDLDFVLLLSDIERLKAEHPAFLAPNVEMVRMPPRNGLVRLLWQLPKLQSRLRLDLFHLQYRLPLWTAGPCICTIHDVLFESHPQFFSKTFAIFARLSSRDAIRRAAALLTVSAYSRQHMAQVYGVAPQRIAVTHNGVDVRRFHPGKQDLQVVTDLGLESGGYLCIVGRLEPRKNHLNLVRAYAALSPEHRIPLVVIGQRDFSFDDTFAEVDRLGLKQHVRFLERVNDDALPALIRHAAVFVYPTWAEGFGMPVLEAMASGVSVVTSDNTSLPEVAGDVAFMCQPQDVPSITRAITAALSESAPDRAQRHAEGVARAHKFSWESSAAVLIGVIRHQLSTMSPN